MILSLTFLFTSERKYDTMILERASVLCDPMVFSESFFKNTSRRKCCMKKIIALLIVFAMLTCLMAGCGKKNTGRDFEVLYDEDMYVLRVNYTGLDMAGLESANENFGSNGNGKAFMSDTAGGCSITFAQYSDGKIGAVRNMDLQLSDYCSYEVMINPGKNVKYATWGLSYTGFDDKTFSDILKTGLSDERYANLPFTTTDTMSFGYDESGSEASLYCAVLMRTDQKDENGNYLWACDGTYPNAPIRCCTQSIPTLVATQCLSIDAALAYVGAVDEKYNRIFPNVEPTLDVYTLSIDNGVVSNHWFEVVAMEDSTGRHGVLEFMDNYAIWHEDIDYSFNFFLQDEFLYNEDGTYREDYGAGIGRYEAVVPYLDEVMTLEDHVTLMDGIRYSFMTYYNEEAGYVGHDWNGNPVDWRSEFTQYDVWAKYHSMKQKNLDTRIADSVYSLWANYLNTETGEIEKIDSYQMWLDNRDHLKAIYTMNYVLAEENREEIMNFMRWSGLFYNSLSWEDVRKTNSGWETYFRVVADPMNCRLSRWFNERITTADSVGMRSFESLK